MMTLWVAICLLLVWSANLPVLAGLLQYLLVGFSALHTNLSRVGSDLPNVAIVIPAWNEEAVIGTTIDRLMKLDYPLARLRVYIVDDASTDETPDICRAKEQEYPGNVFHLRRENGGQGKAHTLNHGLAHLWTEDWTEAVLIMDADVIYREDSLQKMARHLSDPTVGAVTAYIKEGSAEPNWVQRFIGFEYITATGVSRRSQNVLGFLACLSGGAQLHSRENMMAIGGRIFDDTLAEDTFTTFRTQLGGRRALFEPNAIVYAEEPCDLVGLYKQRLRWARGNVQITSLYRRLWGSDAGGLGSPAMALLWFSIFLMPAFQMGASVGLLGLYSVDAPLAWQSFRALWVIAALTYLVVTFVSMAVDVESAKRTWFEGVLFPGFVSFGLIMWTLLPKLFAPLAVVFDAFPWLAEVGLVGVYSWPALSMAVAYLAKVVADKGWPVLARWLLMTSGYGAFLGMVTVFAVGLEYKGAARTWDKTVKTGKVS